MQGALERGVWPWRRLAFPSDLGERLVDWHQSNWFAVPAEQGQKIAHFLGSCPGDPTADVVFGFVFALFQMRLEHRLRKNGLMPTVVSNAGWGVFQPSDGSQIVHEVVPCAFMDDIAVGVEASDPFVLLGRLARVTEICIEVARSLALSLNFDAGKTEANFRLKGVRGEVCAGEFGPERNGGWGLRSACC